MLARPEVVFLVTAMAAGLAMIPPALGGAKARSEIQTPMAVVILCTLMTSTLLNMIVVWRFSVSCLRPGA